MFELEKIKRESKLAPDDIARIEVKVKEELPEDELMFELHFLRVLKAIKEGWVTLEEAVRESVEV
jgi:hypothetical protein